MRDILIRRYYCYETFCPRHYDGDIFTAKFCSRHFQLEPMVEVTASNRLRNESTVTTVDYTNFADCSRPEIRPKVRFSQRSAYEYYRS